MTNHDRIGALEEAARKTSSQNRIMAAVAAGIIFIAALAWLVIRDYPGDREPVYYQDESALPHPQSRCLRGTPEQKGALALPLVNYDFTKLGYLIYFKGPKRGYLAVTFTGTNTIEMYIRRCDSIENIASVLAHEIGHAVDDILNTPEDRGEYLRLRGISGEWFGCNRCTDYNTPAGDWAEVFAFYHSPPGRFRSKMAGPPAPELRAQLEPFWR